MTSALALADQGYQVHLVERKDFLGGNALKLHTTWRGGLVRTRLQAMIKRVLDNDRITVHFKEKVTGVSGTVGNFTTTLESDVEIRHGIVILAIGAEPLRPEGMYLYKDANIYLTNTFP